MPDEWKEESGEMELFNLEATLNRLSEEAQGAIWSKLL
jgi:hypothetical protein